MYKVSYILEHCKTFRSIAGHYSVLSFIGGSQTINCSFTSDTVQSTGIHSDEGILDLVLGKTIKIEITETTENEEYACICEASDRNDYLSVISLLYGLENCFSFFMWQDGLIQIELALP